MVWNSCGTLLALSSRATLELRGNCLISMVFKKFITAFGFSKASGFNSITVVIPRNCKKYLLPSAMQLFLWFPLWFQTFSTAAHLQEANARKYQLLSYYFSNKSSAINVKKNDERNNKLRKLMSRLAVSTLAGGFLKILAHKTTMKLVYRYCFYYFSWELADFFLFLNINGALVTLIGNIIFFHHS